MGLSTSNILHYLSILSLTFSTLLWQTFGVDSMTTDIPLLDSSTTGPIPIPGTTGNNTSGNGGGSGDDNLSGWATAGIVLGVICACVCLERLYSSCKTVYEKRQGKRGFSQLGGDTGRPKRGIPGFSSRKKQKYDNLQEQQGFTGTDDEDSMDFDDP